MAKVIYKNIKSVVDFARGISELTKDTTKGFVIFRGQGSHGDDVESGAYRRLRDAYRKEDVTAAKLVEYHKTIIEEAGKRCESHSIIKNACDMIILGEIQHYGGATNLIDFTYNSMTALYFACRNKGEGPKKQSKVFCLNIESTEKFSEITSNYINKNFSDLIDGLDKKDSAMKRFYKWIPPLENNRIIKQDSIFIFNGDGKIYEEEFDCIYVIDGPDKKNILFELEKGYFISEESLFPDFVGFVEANAAAKPLEKIDANYYFSKAIGLQHKGELDNAIELYEKVIAIKPDYHYARNNMGIAYAAKREYDVAVRCFKEAVEIKPDFHEAWFNMGVAQYNKGENDEAIRCYNEAVKIKPDKQEAWHNLGNTYINKGEFDQAIRCCKEAVKIIPTDDETWNNMGIAHNAKGEYNEAIKNYKKALEINPDYAEAWYNLGAAYKEKGDIEKADDCFKKAEDLKNKA